jgi:hypothetical protein
LEARWRDGAQHEKDTPQKVPAGLLGVHQQVPIQVSTDPDPAFFLIADPDPWFDDLKLKKIYSWKFNFYFLDQKLQFTFPLASVKDAQATGEAFSPQKRTALPNMKILYFFLFLCIIFTLLDPDPQFECGSGSSNSN